MFSRALLLSCGLLAACGRDLGTSPEETAPSELADSAPTGMSVTRTARIPGNAHTRNPNGIGPHGGPLLTGTTGVYFIWYGNWAGSLAPVLLPELAHGLGGSDYFNINTTYFDPGGVPVRNAVEFRGAATDLYSHGKNLSDADVQEVVSQALHAGKFAADSEAVYFVLSSADVAESSGFCSQYCGWHNHAKIVGDIQYAFAGNPSRCPGECSTGAASPNGDPAADSLASIVAHELEETVTDPHLDAWFSEKGRENADKCAWTYGDTYPTPNGGIANMRLGERDFLIQQNWVNRSGGYCATRL